MRLLKAIGYGVLALVLVLTVLFGGAIFAVIGALVTKFGIGLLVVIFVAYLLKEYFEGEKPPKD